MFQVVAVKFSQQLVYCLNHLILILPTIEVVALVVVAVTCKQMSMMLDLFLDHVKLA